MDRGYYDGDNYHNMVYYARNNFHTFEEEAFNEVDSLIFSWLCYLYIPKDLTSARSKEGILIRDLLRAEDYDSMFDNTWSKKETLDLLMAVAASPRFRHTTIRYYRDELDPDSNLQFSAQVYSYAKDCHHVSFRGTDWSITGWKEDFLMALKDPIPSHVMGIDFLNAIGEELEGTFILGGHSKGGNLAVYCASQCKREVQDRIQTIYSHDGPGFLDSILETEGFLRIQDRIHKYVPYFSIFGYLFKCESQVKIIESNEKMIMQHNPISWRVEDHHLYETIQKSMISHSAIDKMNRWINGLSESERIVFIESVFHFLDDTGVDNINDMRDYVKKNIPGIVKKLSKADKNRRTFMFYCLEMMILSADDVVGKHEMDTKNKMLRLAEELLPDDLSDTVTDNL